MKTITKTDATTLDELTDLLNAYENKAAVEREDPAAADALRVDEAYNLTSLPTYGGEEPADTMGIYAWDKTHLLYADGNAPCGWYTSPRVERAPGEMQGESSAV